MKRVGKVVRTYTVPAAAWYFSSGPRVGDVYVASDNLLYRVENLGPGLGLVGDVEVLRLSKEEAREYEELYPIRIAVRRRHGGGHRAFIVRGRS
jgi:hypothetical protein